ncbi:polysaccharide deacetylase family protein [Spartinivicinus poritis]|uniref:Polysaccharide deacetylase family protein n=1 Tax=Spartinivicinus poritis TaxID=2994640 RepID=A0ABT5UB82_9GAMM|nr:polysaccharide deacetylase family protein [Spartinivicinus sp. A2-2]MDE1463440.1 polysaccharide deacetylase family protein [Spartinivicinus sp. A2-2]
MSWQQLATEIEIWATEQKTITLWWRDDDAYTNSAALTQLINLTNHYQIPLCLAVIPSQLEISLIERVEQQPLVWISQHGYSHQNHAPANQRKCELGADRLFEVIASELLTGQNMLQHAFPKQFFPVLVPPWNRLAHSLVNELANMHYIGLSTLGPRQPRKDLVVQNVHVDIINWKQRQFAGEKHCLTQLIQHLQARRLNQIDRQEATGLMTHHLDHDAGCWQFCRQLCEFLKPYSHVQWQQPNRLFSKASVISLV